MVEIKPGHTLTGDQRADPIVWVARTPVCGWPLNVHTDTETLAAYLGTKGGMKLRSFGHDPETGVHWLLTKGGTTLHADIGFLRYSHQLCLRVDSNRIRGLADKPTAWPVFEPGIMYCLDTHSPHQGLPDPRRPGQRPWWKAVIAADRDEILQPQEAWALLSPYLARQITDTPPALVKAGASPKWKPPK